LFTKGMIAADFLGDPTGTGLDMLIARSAARSPRRSRQLRSRSSISSLDESEEQKERQAKAWLRATLEKFANDIKEGHGANADDR
jgi:hypothetical protein